MNPFAGRRSTIMAGLLVGLLGMDPGASKHAVRTVRPPVDKARKRKHKLERRNKQHGRRR